MPSADPLNLSGDDLYGVYRKGLITRHISANGRFLDAVALELVDDRIGPDILGGRDHVSVTHSSRIGERGPHVVTRTPTANVRYANEADVTRQRDGRYAVAEHAWAPLVRPMKYPGTTDRDTVEIRRGPSPWWPQAPTRLRGKIPKAFFAVTGTSDNPLYYGGMALAAMCLESTHGVSRHSLTYARALLQGIRQHEMNGRDGYLIRQDRWLIPPDVTTLFEHQDEGSWVKRIRGASNEELLGTMLGITFYINAERGLGLNSPLRQASEQLRDRVLAAVGRGHVWSKYAHPFMEDEWSDPPDNYYVKNYEYALNASAGRDGGSAEMYIDNIFGSVWGPINANDRMQNIVMVLYSMVLVLCGDLSDASKEIWAMRFLQVIKLAIDTNRDRLKGNAFLAVVALLVNSYLNPARDPQDMGAFFSYLWTMSIAQTWPSPDIPSLPVSDFEELIAVAKNRVFDCRSLNNEDATPGVFYHDQWQHNLPFGSLSNPPLGTLWVPRNPHQRMGADFEWKTDYPQWWTWVDEGNPAGLWGYYKQLGWADGVLNGMSEADYFGSDANRYRTTPDGAIGGYDQLEIQGFRGHREIQVEGAAASLLFLRMLLTEMDPVAFPPPAIPDANVLYPILPFPGALPLSPRFLDLRGLYRGEPDGWEIGGDQDKAIGVVALRDHIVITATASPDDDVLWLDSWRLVPTGIEWLGAVDDGVFDQIAMASATSAGAVEPDWLVAAVRVEEGSILRDDHWLELRIYRVDEAGTLMKLRSAAITVVDPDSAQEVDLCVLSNRFACVTYKTPADRARIKVYDLRDLAEVTDLAAEFDEGGYQRNDVDGVVLIAEAWSDVIINGYQTDGRLRLFSRRLQDMGHPSTADLYGEPNAPAEMTTVFAHDRYFLVVAMQSAYRQILTLNSFEILPTGELVPRGEQKLSFVDDLLLRSAGRFERMRMSRISLGSDDSFVLAGKSRVASGKGLVVIYGEVVADGRATARDWNCLGGGDDDSVQMVDVSGEASSSAGPSVVTVTKSKNDAPQLAQWRFSLPFDLATDDGSSVEGFSTPQRLVNYTRKSYDRRARGWAR